MSRIRALRTFGIAVATIVALVLAFACYVYIASERLVHRRYDAPLTSIHVPTDSAAIAEGRRKAATRGCSTCHEPNLAGRIYYDEPGFARMVSPNLTEAVRRYSDAELARLVRYGVRANGESVFEMPVAMLRGLSDADLGEIIAFLRSAPPVAGPGYAFEPRSGARLVLAFGRWRPIVEEVLDGPLPPATTPSDSTTLGRYLAETTCTECHGPTFAGSATTPDLRIAAAYSDADFQRLLRTRIAQGNHEVGLMTRVAQSRFSNFTDEEIRALHAFLRSRAGLSLMLRAETGAVPGSD